MRVAKLHVDEVDIDEALVRRLLREQLPQWAELPLSLVEPSGTDNVMVRLGDALVLRLPRTEIAAAGVAKEQGLVPRIVAALPVDVRSRVTVPVPVGSGEPGAGYPWHWSVYPWIPGRSPAPEDAGIDLATDLAGFARALRKVDTFGLRAEGPLHSYRADSLQLRDEVTRRSLGACTGLLDIDEVATAWHRAKNVPDHRGEPVWMHSDLQPGNLLISGSRLAAVIDWGGVALGDPAVDCMVAWNLLTPATRPVFREQVDVDDGTWARGRAWALSVALVALPYYRHTNAQITAYSRYAIDQVVADLNDH